MKVLLSIPRDIELFLKKQRKPMRETLRSIIFCIKTKMSEGTILYNTLTKEMILLEPGDENNKDIQELLYEHWFLVPLSHDDLKLADELRELAALRMERKQEGAITSLTILTTTDCNARCFYCYEHGIKKEHMTPETAMDLVHYIERKHLGKPVSLHWFGGEPLYNAAVIDLICRELAGRNIQYRSDMVSNAFLFDSDMVQRAVQEWHLSRVQVTLDGTENIYNQRKAYITPGCNPYRRVLDNIGLLLNAGIQVNIRLNLDRNNEQDLHALCGELAEKFAGEKKLFVYPSLLSPEEMPLQELEDMQKRLEKLEDLIADTMILSGHGQERNVKTNACMADHSGAVVVLPDGSLHSCDHLTNGSAWGHICSEQIDQENLAFFRKEYPREESCRTCPYYPQCIRLVCCPPCSFPCTDLYRRKHERKIQRFIMRYWQLHLKNIQDKDHESEIPNC